jgi:hypothetical protein
MTTDHIDIRDHEQFRGMIADLDSERTKITALLEATAPAAAGAKAAAGAATGPADCVEAVVAYQELTQAVSAAYTEATTSAKAGADKLAGVTNKLTDLQHNLIGIAAVGAEVVRET